jgi:hypothetical protein
MGEGPSGFGFWIREIARELSDALKATIEIGESDRFPTGTIILAIRR